MWKEGFYQQIGQIKKVYIYALYILYIYTVYIYIYIYMYIYVPLSVNIVSHSVLSLYFLEYYFVSSSGAEPCDSLPLDIQS